MIWIESLTFLIPRRTSKGMYGSLAPSSHTRHKSLYPDLRNCVPLFQKYPPQIQKSGDRCHLPAHSPAKLIPQMLYGIEVRTARGPLHTVHTMGLEMIGDDAGPMRASIVACMIAPAPRVRRYGKTTGVKILSLYLMAFMLPSTMMRGVFPGCAQANDTCLHSSGSEVDTSGRVERNSSDPDTATCVEYAKTVPGYHTCLWRFYAVLRM